MRLLDRYILRNFLEPFLICFFGIIAIWLVFDLSDNGPDFIEVHAPLRTVGRFYLTQLPQTVLTSVPVGLLLGLLFSLSRMSRTNEIIAMLSAGRSVLRIMRPLILTGILLSVGCLALNYRLAPHAEAAKKTALEQIKRTGKKKGDRSAVEGYLFRDRMNLRTWYVRKLRPDYPELTGIHVTQQDSLGAITRKWYAARARFEPEGHIWALERGMIVDFNADGDVAKIDDFSTGSRKVTGWSETPWRILSAHLEAQDLSVPELRDYLRFNWDFPEVQLAPYRTYLGHRLAAPWMCLVVVFLAAPLGIVFSRRGVLAGVAAAIFLFFASIFFGNFCLALGKGLRIPPLAAAWLPNLLFGLIGLVLVYYRSTGRDLPKFSFKRR